MMIYCFKYGTNLIVKYRVSDLMTSYYSLQTAMPVPTACLHFFRTITTNCHMVMERRQCLKFSLTVHLQTSVLVLAVNETSWDNWIEVSKKVLKQFFNPAEAKLVDLSMQILWFFKFFIISQRRCYLASWHLRRDRAEWESELTCLKNW